MNKQDIINWFEIVCNGIRSEYRDGWSHRDLETDKETLSELLGGVMKIGDEYTGDELEDLDYEIAERSFVIVPVSREGFPFVIVDVGNDNYKLVERLKRINEDGL